MAGLMPSPKSPKSQLPGKFGPEIPAPSIETGENGERGRGVTSGEFFRWNSFGCTCWGGASPSWPAKAATCSTTLTEGNLL